MTEPTTEAGRALLRAILYRLEHDGEFAPTDDEGILTALILAIEAEAREGVRPFQTLTREPGLREALLDMVALMPADRYDLLRDESRLSLTIVGYVECGGGSHWHAFRREWTGNSLPFEGPSYPTREAAEAAVALASEDRA